MRQGAEVKLQRDRSVYILLRLCVCVCVSVGLEVLKRSFLVSLRRSAVVKEKTPVLSGMNITR